MSDIEELWCSHAGEVQSFLQRRCCERELAEDLTNETFLQAGRAIARGKKVNVGWLMTVARRRLIDHWRNVGRQAATIQALQLERSFEVGHAFAPDLSTTSDALHEALGSLCATQHDAVVLRYCQDNPVSAVACELHLSYRATESVLARARQKLRSEYISSMEAVSAGG